jgi:hypothetical protein
MTRRSGTVSRGSALDADSSTTDQEQPTHSARPDPDQVTRRKAIESSADAFPATTVVTFENKPRK